MYESGTEFQVVLTDFNCNFKFDGQCQHDVNLDKETGKGLKWCDESICPIALKNHTKKCVVCSAKVPATYECECGWKDDGTEYTDKRCGCGFLLQKWDSGTFMCSCGKEHEGSYYCSKCDTEQLHYCDGTMDVIS